MKLTKGLLECCRQELEGTFVLGILIMYVEVLLNFSNVAVVVFFKPQKQNLKNSCDCFQPVYSFSKYHF